jgi:hypothetical protein
VFGYVFSLNLLHFFHSLSGVILHLQLLPALHFTPEVNARAVRALLQLNYRMLLLLDFTHLDPLL